MPSEETRLSRRPAPRALATEAPPQVNDWEALGTAFEGLTKAGLALTIGFSVAAVFCKMVDSGKVKTPDLLGNLARAALIPDAPERRKENGG